MIESKNAMVRRLVKEHRYKEALQICQDWNYSDPNSNNVLRRGYECLLYPRFYEQIGFNPEQEYQKAVTLLIEVYGEDSQKL